MLSTVAESADSRKYVHSPHIRCTSVTSYAKVDWMRQYTFITFHVRCRYDYLGVLQLNGHWALHVKVLHISLYSIIYIQYVRTSEYLFGSRRHDFQASWRPLIFTSIKIVRVLNEGRSIFDDDPRYLVHIDMGYVTLSHFFTPGHVDFSRYSTTFRKV